MVKFSNLNYSSDFSQINEYLYLDSAIGVDSTTAHMVSFGFHANDVTRAHSAGSHAMTSLLIETKPSCNRKYLSSLLQIHYHGEISE